MTETKAQLPAPGKAAIRLRGTTPPLTPPKPKLKKLRLFLVFMGLSFIALISTIFGMMMAVSSDLPDLENRAEFQASRNSIMRAANDTPIAKLTGNNNRILVGESQINPSIKNAVIAIEDKRFYQHRGVDYQGIVRALGQDVLQQRAAQGASTITQQFVKNATEAASQRTVLQKLREAALAYHLERRWSKQKILTEYLNTVYFGNGAYGIESAVRTYYPHGGRTEGKPAAPPGQAPLTDSLGQAQQSADTGYDPNERAAENVTPDQAAMIAGVIASPSAYDPARHPKAALDRRNLVLGNMLDQKTISQAQHDEAAQQAMPSKDTIRPPQPISNQPYWSTWVTQQLVDRYGAQRVFSGGLDIKTTINPKLQQAAMEAINSHLAGIGPAASLVAIENKTGEVRAMVGGTNYKARPFNLATNGHRQPGSSIKPFTLIEALRQGISPGATFASKKKIFPVPGSPKEKFVVNNYEGDYTGVSDLTTATVRSDNSVYAELGLKVGTRKISRLARRMGLRTRVSTNPAMTLGGLKVGLTPLEMAYAYSTIANGGKRISGTLASGGKGKGPVAIEEVRHGHTGPKVDENRKKEVEIFPPAVGDTVKGILQQVVQDGTGKQAQIGEFAAGKTGTTENYGDAWFVGFNAQYTVAVWVGYPDKLKPMKTEYQGSPVAGGTFPAQIWQTFMSRAIEFRDTRDARRQAKLDEKNGGSTTDTGTGTGTAEPYTAPAQPQTGGGGDAQPKQQDGGGKPDGGGQQQAPQRQPKQEARPTPTPTPAPTPTPTPVPTPGGGAKPPTP